MNIGVSDDAAVVVSFVLGIEPDALKVSIEKGLLTISFTRSSPALPVKGRYYARERVEGDFTRVLESPGDVDPDRVGARYLDRCLVIFITKKESSKPRLIAIQ